MEVPPDPLFPSPLYFPEINMDNWCVTFQLFSKHFPTYFLQM